MGDQDRVKSIEGQHSCIDQFFVALKVVDIQQEAFCAFSAPHFEVVTHIFQLLEVASDQKKLGTVASKALCGLVGNGRSCPYNHYFHAIKPSPISSKNSPAARNWRRSGDQRIAQILAIVGKMPGNFQRSYARL